MVFRGVFPNLQLRFHGNVEKTKFLGMMLDTKLSWVPHLRYQRTESLKALNLFKYQFFRIVSSDRSNLIRIYRAKIHFKLDYGS